MKSLFIRSKHYFSHATYGAPDWILIGLRIMAGNIDFYVVNIIFSAFMGLLANTGSFSAYPYMTKHMLAELFWVVYFCILWSSRWQATIGMKLVGLKMTDLAGNVPSFRACFSTYLILGIPLLWYSRCDFLLILMHIPSSIVLHPTTITELCISLFATNGKAISFVIIGAFALTTEGRQHLGNLYGRTQIIRTFRLRSER